MSARVLLVGLPQQAAWRRAVSGPTLTLEDARQAIEGLSDADLLRAEKMGRIFALRAGCEVRPLLNDAIASTLSGDRKCPCNMPMLQFLVGVMRSKASARKETQSRRPEMVALDATSSIGLLAHETVPSSERDPEEVCAAQEEFSLRTAALEELFAGDEPAMLFVWARLEGLEKEEIMTMNNLDETAYDTICRRVRRRIDRRFPNGWET